MPDRRSNFLNAVKDVFGNKKFRSDPRALYGLSALGFAGVAAYSVFSPAAPAFFASLSSTMSAQEVLVASSAASLWCVVSCGQSSEARREDPVRRATGQLLTDSFQALAEPAKRTEKREATRPDEGRYSSTLAVQESPSSLH